MSMRKLTGFIILIILIAGCRQQRKDIPVFTNKDINAVITGMTDIMIHDVTNPPLAARFYAYACLAGYEVVVQHNTQFSSMHGLLNDYPDLHRQDSISGYSYQLSAVLAMLETASQMQPSGSRLRAYEQRLLDSCKELGYPEAMINQSKRYAMAISKSILVYAKADGYNRISNLPRYTPLKGDAYWYPTPPAFIAAVEPYFKTVRPFTLDSSAQFKPQSPVPFSRDKGSAFYRLMEQNYKETLPDAHKVIAAFWDCNPFAVQDNGHLLVALKKISPGAHWLGIAGIAAEKTKKSFDESMQVYTLVSVGLMDAFICCWVEKYRSNRVRSVTRIRKCIDPT